MGSESHDWCVPAPVRPLMWWPAITFILLAIEPGTSPAVIAGIGALLTVLGALIAAMSNALRRSAPRAAAQPSAPTGPGVSAPGVSA